MILGRPGYYHRFGFEPAGPLGIVYPPVGPGDPRFMIRRLEPSAVPPGGIFTYGWER